MLRLRSLIRRRRAPLACCASFLLVFSPIVSAATDWVAVERAEAAVYTAFDDHFARPSAAHCRQHAGAIAALAKAAPRSLTVQWLQVACALAGDDQRRARKLREKALARLPERALPTTEAAIDLKLPLLATFDARALAGLLGENLVDVELRLSDDWARIDWLALYVDAQGHERRVLFDATARSSAQLRRGVADMEVSAARKPWLEQEMGVFPAFWMYQSWRQADADEALFAAAAATFNANGDDDEEGVRALAAIALAGNEGLFRVRHATWLLRKRQALSADTLSALAQTFRGRGDQELGNQVFEVLLPASDARLSDALALMAALSHHGIVLPKSTKQRDRYLKAYAMRRSAPEADFQLGRLLLAFDTGLADVPEGRRRLLAAAQAGYMPAWPALATHCAQLEQDAARPAECAEAPLQAGLKLASEAGQGLASTLLALHLAETHPEDRRGRVRLLRLAVDQGDAFAPWLLVAAWDQWEQKPKREWRQLLELGMQRGDEYALHAIGVLYRNGMAMAKDPDQACFWFERAAERGHVEAMEDFADMALEHGCGIPADEVRGQATRWLAKAADAGNEEAQVRLATLSEQWGGASNLERARALYALAADEGNVSAAARLGWMCERGLGGPVEVACALRNYQRWAAKGDADGVNNLARMYRDGTGVAVDTAKAIQLFAQAAEAGSHHAQCNLGDLLLQGDDASRHAEGRTLLEQSATAGNHYCRIRVGEGRAYGRDGFEQDPALALKWLELARREDNPDADGTEALARWLSHPDNPAADLGRARTLLAADPARHCQQIANLWLREANLEQAIGALESVQSQLRPECNTMLAELLTHLPPASARLQQARALVESLPQPLAADALLVRARIAMHQGRTESALTDFARLLGDTHVAKYWLGRYCSHAGVDCPVAADEARKLAKEALALEGNDGNNLAWVLATDPLADADAGRYALQLVSALPGIEQSPGWLDTRACAEARTGDFAAARRTAATARAQASASQADTRYFDRRIAQLARGDVCNDPY